MDINNISNRTVFRILLIIGSFVGLIFLVMRLHRELVWLATAFFLAVALNPAVESLSKFMPKRKRGLAAGVVFILAIALLAFMVFTLIPPLVDQTQALIHDLPNLADKLQHASGTIPDFARQHDLVQVVKNNQSQFVSRLTSFSGSFVGIVRGIATSLVATLTVLVLTFFMIVEGPQLMRGFWKLHPSARQTHRKELASQMYKAVTGYVTGNLLTSLIAGVVSAIALTLIGMRFAIPLGIVVGIFDLVPLVGATLAAFAVCGLTLVYSDFSAALIMAIFFLVYQQIENHFLQPLVYSRTVKMSPLMVLVSAILGASLAGLLGALLAIPVAASLQILGKDFLVRHPRS